MGYTPHVNDALPLSAKSTGVRLTVDLVRI
jgi:hypothetical protein